MVGMSDLDPVTPSSGEHDSEYREEEDQPRRRHNVRPGQTDNTGARVDLEALRMLIDQLKQPTSTMPMPSSESAPRFKGNNLRSFLDDYEIATKGAGWSPKQKCDYLHTYCNRETRELVKRIDARKSGDWHATVQALKDLYSTEDQADRYSRDSLDKFVRKERRISNKKQFVEYYRGFCRRVQGLKETVTQGDVNRLFWKGLPPDLQRDVYYELRAQRLVIDRHTAPEIKLVRVTAMSVLDKDSLFANLTASRGNSKNTKGKDKSDSKGKKRRSQKFYKDSEDEDSDSDESESSQSDSEYDSDKSEFSSSEEEESDGYKRRKTSRRRSFSRHREDKTPKGKEVRRKDAKTNAFQTGKKEVDLGYAKDNVTNLSDQLKKLALMFEQSPKDRADQEEFPRHMDLEAEPSNKRILNLMKQITVQLQDQRNDTQALLDRRRSPSIPRSGPISSRCFFCQKFNTHPRGTINCPEAQEMVREGHCIFKDGRVYMPDGMELPRIRPDESMSAIIRSLNASRAQRRMPNPGRSNGQSPQVAFASIIDSSETADEYDCDDEMGPMGAHSSLWYDVLAADRTEKPKGRFDPINKEKRVQWKEDGRSRSPAPPRAKPYVELPPVPKQWNSTPYGTQAPRRANVQPKEQTERRTEPKPVKALPTPPNQETQDRREPKGKENATGILKNPPYIQKSDFTIRDDPRTPHREPEKILPRSLPRARFTTTMREQFKSNDVYQKVLGTNVTLPLGELLAACPDIEKTLSTETKLRTVPVTHATPRDKDEDMHVDMGEAFTIACAYEFDDESEAEIEEVSTQDDYTIGNEYMSSFANTHFVQDETDHRKKKTKMISSTGTFVVRIGHVDGIVAMVDSGAEMNMVTPPLAEELRNRYAEDDKGKQLRMKNVSGDISDLKGCFKDVPLWIGGAKINETFFEGQHWGSNFDVILGQTFLRNNACKMSWSGGSMIMRVHPSGSQDGDSITVRLTEASRREREGPAIAVDAAIIVGMAEIVGSTDWDSGSAATSETSGKKTLSPSENYGPKDKEEQALIDDVEERLRSLSTQEKDDQKYSSMEWERIDLEQVTDKARPQTLEADERGSRKWSYHQLAAMSAQEASELSFRFNEAVNDFRPRTTANAPYASIGEMTRVYNRRIYRARYDIPIRERVLTIAEGEHVVTVNGRNARAVLDATAHYNLITNKTRRRIRLTAQTTEQAGETWSPDFYCPYVPIELNEDLPLPGLFLVVEHIPGGYEILMGKPWMISIEKLHTRVRNEENNLRDKKIQQEYERRVFPDLQSASSEADRIAAPPRKIRRVTRIRKKAPRSEEWYPGEFDEWRREERVGKIEGDTRKADPSESNPRNEHVSPPEDLEHREKIPELGGSLAKTL